ncbi:MAG: hypothetical protein ACOCY1_00425 [Halovenus sp.]
MTMATDKSQSGDDVDPETIDDRDVRALTEYLFVEEFAEDLYRVYSEDGSFQVVEPDIGACECKDMQYRNPNGGCKHIRRTEFWTGRRELPAWADREAMDPLLVEAIGDA